MNQQYTEGDTFPIDIHRVVDGDVLEVYILGLSSPDEKRMEVVRLYGIDAPEPTQRYWAEAVSYLERLSLDGRFWLKIVDVDKYGVIIGDVYRNSVDETISRDMVRAGWAYHRRDVIGCELGLQDLEQLEQRAFFDAVGVWQEGGGETRPSVYRRIVREAEEERRRIAREKEDEARRKLQREEEDIVRRYDEYNRRKDRVAAVIIFLFSVASFAILFLIGYSLGIRIPLPYWLGYSLMTGLWLAALVSGGMLIVSAFGSTNVRMVLSLALCLAFIAYVIYTPNRVLGNFDVYFAMCIMGGVFYIRNRISGRVDWDEWKVIDGKGKSLDIPKQ